MEFIDDNTLVIIFFFFFNATKKYKNLLKFSGKSLYMLVQRNPYLFRLSSWVQSEGISE